MRHTEEITVTMHGLSGRSKTYSLPRTIAEELEAYIEAQTSSDCIAARDIFPDAFDPVKGPAVSLRGLRYREELTQKQLADKLGIRQHHLSEMENCKRSIGKAMARKLAKALNGDWRTLM